MARGERFASRARLDVDRSHEIASERDLIELLEADIGVRRGA
jgi:hypothetical protein